MSAFDHVLVLLSFVYALALTHLLSRVGQLFVARARVKSSAFVVLSATNAVWGVFFSWLALWAFRNTNGWDLASIVLQFVFAVLLYFICAFAAPDAAPEGTIDLEAFYWQQRRPFYGAFVLCVALGMAGNFTFLNSPDPSQFFKWNEASLPMFVPPILALVTRARWAQWAAGIGLLLVQLVLTITLEAKLT